MSGTHTRETVFNVNNVSTLANSRAEHNIYSYHTTVDSDADLKRKGFFNTGYSFLTVGDVIRVFQYAKSDIKKYYEFIVVGVDLANHIVDVAVMQDRNLEKITI